MATAELPCSFHLFLECLENGIADLGHIVRDIHLDHGIGSLGSKELFRFLESKVADCYRDEEKDNCNFFPIFPHGDIDLRMEPMSLQGIHW